MVQHGLDDADVVFGFAADMMDYRRRSRIVLYGRAFIEQLSEKSDEVPALVKAAVE